MAYQCKDCGSTNRKHTVAECASRGGEQSRMLMHGARVASWRADEVVTNHEGQRVWLKQIPQGITDCCPEAEPCERHARIAS